jgi:hypothetical protein
MTAEVFVKLLAVFATVAIGWVAGRQRWLGPDSHDPARTLSNVAFYIFVPALLFRTMARLDLAAMPWRMLAAYFVPALAWLLVVYAGQRGARAVHGPAAPATRAITATYGNAVQLGIPMAAALFGEEGLAIHIALVALHGLVLLTLLTVLVETDLARADRHATLASTVRTTVRNTIVHPVVLPVLAGLAWNFTGIGLPAVADQTLAGLGAAVVPVCLVLIGVSLATYGLQGRARSAAILGAAKLLVLPALVLGVAHWGFGLAGTPLSVLVMMAALPVGANAVIFAQRYATLQAEAAAAVLFSTVGFVAGAAWWLAVLGWLGGS